LDAGSWSTRDAGSHPLIQGYDEVLTANDFQILDILLGEIMRLPRRPGLAMDILFSLLQDAIFVVALIVALAVGASLAVIVFNRRIRHEVIRELRTAVLSSRKFIAAALRKKRTT
jgi:hypothetical protein